MRLWLSAEAGFAVGGQASAALIDGAQLKVYPGAPHGITDTHLDQVNADLLNFLRRSPKKQGRRERMAAVAAR